MTNNDVIVIKIPAGNYTITSEQLEQLDYLRTKLKEIFEKDVYIQGVE